MDNLTNSQPAFAPLPAMPTFAAPTPVTTAAPTAPAQPMLVPPIIDSATLGPTIVEPSLDPQPSAPLVNDGAGGINALTMYLGACVAVNGSDLHLQPGTPPRVRVHGELADMDGGYPVFSAETIWAILDEALPEKRMQEFREHLDVDLAYEIKKDEGAYADSRFRVNLAMASGGPTAVFRVIPPRVIPFDELGLKEQIRKQVRAINRGLFLVTGVTGSGKSTTNAALLNDINEHEQVKIITFEDPIEYRHESKKATVVQREMGQDSKDFEKALRAALRQDPDVILIGELRDPETAQIALDAADTGHLVFATLHTSSAAETVNRLIDLFPGDQRDRVQSVVASVLAGVVCQSLVKSPTKGRVAATEILVMNDGIRNSIRTGKIHQIDQLMNDQSTGSLRLDNHLAELVKTGDITPKAALEKSQRRDELTKLIGGNL